MPDSVNNASVATYVSDKPKQQTKKRTSQQKDTKRNKRQKSKRDKPEKKKQKRKQTQTSFFNPTQSLIIKNIHTTKNDINTIVH